MGAAETLATHTGWTTYENRHDMSHAEERSTACVKKLGLTF
jgi:hypothetical protein